MLEEEEVEGKLSIWHANIAAVGVDDATRPTYASGRDDRTAKAG